MLHVKSGLQTTVIFENRDELLKDPAWQEFSRDPFYKDTVARVNHPLGLSYIADKTEWVKALESGQYVQGSNLLAQQNDETGQRLMCCLGVLCDIAFEAEWELSEDVDGRLHAQTGYTPLAIGRRRDESELPKEFAARATQGDTNPFIAVGTQITPEGVASGLFFLLHAAVANDTYRLNFMQIAGLVRAWTYGKEDLHA